MTPPKMKRLLLDDLSVWGRIPPLSLEQTESIRLLNRIDTKYAMRSETLPLLLERFAAEGYCVQIAGSGPVAPYDTLYYDTKACTMFRSHHNGILRRQKIRTRTYLDSDATYLELKNKTNTGRTKKVRMAVRKDDFGDFRYNPEAMGFLHRNALFAPDKLTPQVNTRFDRITITDRQMSERVTIDFNLCFHNHSTNIEASLPGLSVIELKRDGNCLSQTARLLRELRIHPLKLSKYCIGTVLTNPAVKHNRFKAKLRAIEKLTENTLSYD